MDERGKKISVNASSFVGLQAEVARKREEVRQQKLLNGSTFSKPTPTTKTTIWSKKNAGVLQRAQNDLTEKTEERDILDKSRLALEAKARIYNKMTTGDTIPEEDGSKQYLVDFEQKSIMDRRSERLMAEEAEKRRQEKEEEEEERQALAETVPQPENPEDEWVDYTDSFGRSRRCQKKDLKSFMKADKSGLSLEKKESKADLDLLSNDMRRELQRQAWEKETEDAMKGPVGPTHYANVQFNEVRDHGVGYYQFAKDEEKRHEQMEELNKLRAETQEGRDKRQKIKDKRDAQLQARLAKVRQRKTVQDMLPDLTDLDPMSLANANANEQDVDSKSDTASSSATKELKEAEPIMRDESFKKTAPVREWDRGKVPPVYDEQTWLNSRRDERPSEFAPPASIYQSAAPATKSSLAGKNSAQSFTRPTTNKRKLYGSSNQTISDQRTEGTDNIEQWVSAGIRTMCDRNEKLEDGSAISSPCHSYKENLVDIPLPQESCKSSGFSCDPQDGYSSIGYEYFTGQVQSSTGNESIPYPEIRPSEDFNCWLHHGTPNMNYPPPGYGAWNPNTAQASLDNFSFDSSIINQEIGAYCVNSAVTSWNSTEQSTTNLWNSGENSTVNPSDSGEQSVVNPCCNTEQFGVTTNSNATVSSAAVSYSSLDIAVNNTTDPALSDINEKKEPAAKIVKAPMPVHFRSQPSKPQPKQARYEAIHLHELPPTLPAPPTAESIPCYPSQEEVIGPSRRSDIRKTEFNETAAIKNWQKQFDGRMRRNDVDSKPSSQTSVAADAVGKSASDDGLLLKPKNIPFASPYIQNQRTPGKDGN